MNKPRPLRTRFLFARGGRLHTHVRLISSEPVHRERKSGENHETEDRKASGPGPECRADVSQGWCSQKNQQGASAPGQNVLSSRYRGGWIMAHYLTQNPQPGDIVMLLWEGHQGGVSKDRPCLVTDVDESSMFVACGTSQHVCLSGSGHGEVCLSKEEADRVGLCKPTRINLLEKRRYPKRCLVVGNIMASRKETIFRFKRAMEAAAKEPVLV